MALYSSLAQPPKTSIMRQKRSTPNSNGWYSEMTSPITFFRFPTNQIIFRVIVLAILANEVGLLSHQVQTKHLLATICPKKNPEKCMRCVGSATIKWLDPFLKKYQIICMWQISKLGLEIYFFYLLVPNALCCSL